MQSSYSSFKRPFILPARADEFIVDFLQGRFFLDLEKGRCFGQENYSGADLERNRMPCVLRWKIEKSQQVEAAHGL